MSISPLCATAPDLYFKEGRKECCNEFPIFLTAVKDLLCGINSKWHVGELSGGRLRYFSVGYVLHVCVHHYPECKGLNVGFLIVCN